MNISRRKKIILSVLLAITTGLAFVTLTTKQMSVNAANDVSDIRGIVGQFTEDSDYMNAVVYQINIATGQEIDEGIAEQEEINKAEGSQVSSVESRDWSKYRSSTPFSNMSDSEYEFYDRFDQLCQYYMDNDTIDGYYVKAYGIYAINGVQYNDLGLTSNEAFYVAQWFLYNNPQYYFLKPTFLTTSSAVYVACYDFCYIGMDRAEYTNAMFDQIDSMVDYVLSEESGDYNIEKSFHDMVCGTLDYKAGDYDQSIYSALFECETVCAGYSGLMNVLLNAAGIDTMTVLSSCHAWNQVYLDGEWYGLDTTWDDSLNNYYFFDVCDDTLKHYDSDSSLEHTIETAWVSWTPVLANHDYGSEYTGGNELTLQAPKVGVEILSETSARISWDIVPNADSYEVVIYTDETYFKPYYTQNTVNYNMKLTGLKGGYTYYFSVRAVRKSSGRVYYSDYSYGSYYCEPKAVEPEPEPEPEPIITLSVPSDFKATDVTESSFRASWSVVENADKYEISIYKDSAYSVKLGSGLVSSTTVTISGLSKGQTVYIRVRAVNTDSSEYVYSDFADLSVTAKTAEPVTPVEEPLLLKMPSDLRVSDVTETTARILWDGDASYKYSIEIYKDANYKNCVGKSIVSRSVVNLTNLTADTDYYVCIRSAVDNRYSDWAELSFRTAKPFAAEIPGNFNVSNVTSESAEFTWNAVPDAYYMLTVKRQSGQSNTMTTVYDSKVISNSAVVSVFQPETKYYATVYSVVKHDDMLYNSESATLIFTTDKAVVSVEAPKNCRTSDVTTSSVMLEWDIESGARYEVNVYSDVNRSKLLGRAVLKSGHVAVKGLTADREYYVSIRSCKTVNGELYYSDWYDFSFRTQGANLSVSAPSNISVVDVNKSTVRLLWDSNVRDAQYEVYVYSDAQYTKKLGSAVVSAKSVKISGLKANNTYYFAVRTVDSVNGTTSYSDWVHYHFTK